MNAKLRTLPLFLALVVAGCQPEASKPTLNTPVATETTGGSPAKGATPPDTEPKGPSLSEIPADLKHDGYAYYGLANDKPMDMEAVDSSQPGTMTGAQTIRLKEIKDGKAVFEIERTGNLAMLGTQEVTLEKDGIYVTASSVAKVNHDLELPADIKPDTKWDNRMVVDQKGREIEMDSTFKIVGPAKVKTLVGDRDAILITSTGQGTMRGKKVKMTSRNWYVKDVGGVKSEITIIRPDGQKQTVTIQESKPAAGSSN